MNELTDDYESPEHILGVIAPIASRNGFTTDFSEIALALQTLIEARLAKAYRLSTKEPPIELDGTPTLKQIPGLYFFVTDEGRAIQSADENWPLDDEGFLRREWQHANS